MAHKKEFWRKTGRSVSRKTLGWEELGGYKLDNFIELNIRAGVRSIPELMALTYLSQFEKLDGEFAQDPVFRPDFQVGIIPYSNKLLDLYNGSSLSYRSPGNQSGLELGVCGEEANTVATFQSFLKGGAQLARLYVSNCKNLDRFKDDDECHRKLIHTVDTCVRRDRKMLDVLAYAKK